MVGEALACSTTLQATSIASNIKNLRKSRGLTQEQLAEKMNITSTYILKIENGKQTGSVELAVELAAFFDVSLDYLLSGREFKAMDQKQNLRMTIAFLSELEAKL